MSELEQLQKENAELRAENTRLRTENLRLQRAVINQDYSGPILSRHYNGDDDGYNERHDYDDRDR